MSCCEEPGISRRELGGGRVKEHCRNCGHWVIHVPTEQWRGVKSSEVEKLLEEKGG